MYALYLNLCSTVEMHKLTSHLGKCNSRPKVPGEHHSLNVNAVSSDPLDEDLDSRDPLSTLELVKVFDSFQLEPKKQYCDTAPSSLNVLGKSGRHEFQNV